MRLGYTRSRRSWLRKTNRVYQGEMRYTTWAISLPMRMTLESTNLDLGSQLVPTERPDSHPSNPHHHSHRRRRTWSILPLHRSTRYKTSQPDLMRTGMRCRSTGSSSARIWMHSRLTCAQSCTTKRPSSATSSSSKSNLPSFSPFICHHRHRNDLVDQHGSFRHPSSICFTLRTLSIFIWGCG